MTPPYDSPQANLPRVNPPIQYATQADLTNLQAVINAGVNYRFNNGELQIKNTDQGEYTPIYTLGADGAQTVELRDAQA